MPVTARLIDKLRLMADTGQLRSVAIEIIESLNDDVREWAAAMVELAEQLDYSRDMIKEWRDAEDAEDKRDLRENAIAELTVAIERWDDVAALPPIEGADW
jgi:hypothetical protein